MKYLEELENDKLNKFIDKILKYYEIVDDSEMKQINKEMNSYKKIELEMIINEDFILEDTRETIRKNINCIYSHHV